MDKIPDDGPQLLKAARRGDEGAFLALYNAYRTPLFRFAWRLTGSVPTSEDAVQECFLVLLKGASFEAEQGSLRGYLFGIARNLAFKTLRIAERESAEMDITEHELDPLEDVLSAERSEVVARAVAALPFGQREAIILFEFEGLALEEIAGLLKIETGAVKARLHRARETLRHRLAPLLSTAVERRFS